MKTKLIVPLLLTFIVLSAQAQRKRRPVTVDTIMSNYQPADLFSPSFYPERGNERHGSDGEPGPKYWQNRADYQIKASIDTTSKTLSAAEHIDYTNNSPYALQYLWLQLDQNTYKKGARSNYYTDFTATPNQHTDGYLIESVMVNNGKTLQPVSFVISDTRMQVRLPKALQRNGGVIKLFIKYHYTIPAAFGGRTDYT
ncbi:MAG: M1 family peptidase, partial [Bacteroidetes bacterium]|nr:M1 family peptidase [Bacteroidota bacterium]